MYEKSAREEMEEFLNQCVVLPEMGTYDWEWSNFDSYYDPESGKFYWAEAGGCSCNSFDEEIQSLADYCVGDKQAYLKAAKEYADYGGKDGASIDTIRRAVFELSKK